MRTTVQPAAAKPSSRCTSLSNCLVSVRCWSPSYSTMMRHGRYRRSAATEEPCPRPSKMSALTSGSGSPA